MKKIAKILLAAMACMPAISAAQKHEINPNLKEPIREAILSEGEGKIDEKAREVKKEIKEGVKEAREEINTWSNQEGESDVTQITKEALHTVDRVVDEEKQARSLSEDETKKENREESAKDTIGTAVTRGVLVFGLLLALFIGSYFYRTQRRAKSEREEIRVRERRT